MILKKLILASVALCTCLSGVKAAEVDLLAYNNAVLFPFVWGRDASSSLGKLGGPVDDALLAGMFIMSALQDPKTRSESIASIEAAFDRLMADQLPTGYWHNAAYHPFPEGWYSGMEFASVALAAMTLSEATGNSSYDDIAVELLDQMILPLDEGGVLVDTSKTSCWLSEYAWTGMSETDESYVLNGALFALQALLIGRDRFPGRAEYAAKYQCALDGIKAIAPLYVYEDRLWGYYMLQRPIPLHTHYLIFETVQFDALYEMTGDEFFAEQATRRRSLFADHFPVVTDGESYLFSQLGAPHPFISDIYATKLEFLDARGEIVGSADTVNAQSLEERYFMRGDLPEGAEIVRMTAYSGAQAIELFERPLKQRSGLLAPTSVGMAGVEAYLDAALVEDGVTVDPAIISDPASPPDAGANAQGRISLTFEKPVPKADMAYFALRFETDTPLVWAIGLYDETGAEAYRYLPADENVGQRVLPLSTLGFDDYDELGDVSRVVIYFYTHTSPDPIRFRFNGITLHSDMTELADEWDKLVVPPPL